MRRLILITIVSIILLLTGIGLHAITVTPSGPYYVGDTLTFRPTNEIFGRDTNTEWNFGDGSTRSAKGLEAVTHIYNTAGNYTVTAVGYFGNNDPVTETYVLTIRPRVDNRYILVEPNEPIVNQPATFRAFNFQSPNDIRWDMGDGTILSISQPSAGLKANRFGTGAGAPREAVIAGGSVVTHTYKAPGTYTLRAYDYGGDDGNPVTLLVNVRLPNRTITYTPAQPLAGAPVQFTAAGFLSAQLDWNFGDGTTLTSGVSVTHVYSNAGSYTITAKETNTNYTPTSVVIVVTQPARRINVNPRSPRVDQVVTFQAQNFLTASIDWNFGDGTIITGGSTTVTHRYQNQGRYTISAKDSTINHTPVTFSLSIGAENRYITVSPPEVRTNDIVTITAYNFRGNYILWDFGDGTIRSGLHNETHQYRRAGTYTISARDENGESQKVFTAQIKVEGIDDQVNLQVAEIALANGKHYQVVPKNSQNIRAILRMKMRGTGIISGYWVIDGHPFEFFNEVAYQGVVKEIQTRSVPGLPTIEPGLHTINVVLTRPEDLQVAFPTLKYFVLPYENIIETVNPPDGFIAKEKEIPEFSWKEPKGASKYQVTFSSYLYSIMEDSADARWIDVGIALSYTPAQETWDSIQRNRWTYWKVRALDTAGNVVSESDIHDIKVVIATAEINVDKVTDLAGREITPQNSREVAAQADDILVHGSIEYKGNSEFLVLRVYVDDEMTDQLLFRDVKKNEKRYFETAVPNKKKKSRVQFTVLRVSSPAVIIGIKDLVLKR